jgi:hypothetical protein
MGECCVLHRAGATHVTGAELSQHMCDVAAEAVVMNGYAAKCLMINRDVRRIHASKLPDGTEPAMEHKANLCIYEASAVSSARNCKAMPASAGITKGASAEPCLCLQCTWGGEGSDLPQCSPGVRAAGL